MQRTMKRVGALILAIAMLVTFIPSLGLTEQAHADEEGIKVFMTVSNKGVIAETKDGDAMAWKEVEVKDLDEDGKYTFDEALKAAHEAYNSDDGYDPGTGYVKKLWGVENASYLFFINGAGLSTGVTADEVKSEDYLTAAIIKDGGYYSDYISRFDEGSCLVAAGEDVELELSGHLGMAYKPEDLEDKPLNGIKVGLWKDGEFQQIDGKVTNNGKVTLSFDEPGRYVVTADGAVKDAVVESYCIPMGAGDDKYYAMSFSESDSDSLDYLYTEEDYGEGPYPADEIKKIDMYEYMDLEDDELEGINLIYTSTYVNNSEAYYSVMVDAPIITPCCIVNVVDSCEVKATVSNKGVLASDKDGKAMVEKDVKVLDLNADGKFEVDEALVATHEQYFEGGADGYAYGNAPGYYAVYKLWGVDTTNTMFYVNGKGIPVGVAVDTVSAGDKLYASVNSDSTYWSDIYTSFADTSASVAAGQDVSLQLTATPSMSALTDDGLAGLQIGVWKDGAFEAIEGAVTDKDGNVTFSVEEPGDYLVTARGTVKGEVTIDYTTMETAVVDCPIMAPYCMLKVLSPAGVVDALIDEIGEVTLDSEDAIKAAEEAYKALSDEEKAQVTGYETLLKAKIDFAELKLEETENALAEAQADLDDGTRPNQKEGSMHVVYSTLGMFRTDDANTSIAAKDENTVTVNIKLVASTSVGNFEKIALAKYGKEAEAAITADFVLEEAGKNESDKMTYTATCSFDLPASECGKKIPFSLKYKTEEGWHKYGSQPYMIVLSEALYKEYVKAQEELKKAEDDLNAYLAVEKKKVAGVKVKAGKKKATVSWKSLGSGYTYKVYQLNPSKGTYKAVKTTTKAKVVVKKLKKGKKYCFKVQAQKKVNGLTAFTKESKVVKSKKIK